MSQGSGAWEQGSEAPRNKRTWLWVLAGAFVLFMFVAIGGLFFAISFFRDSMQVTENVTDIVAVNEFDAVYAKYAGQQPLIQLVDDRPQLVADRASRTPATQPLTTLRVVAFDRGDGEMVQFSLPFWLLRMRSDPVRLSAYQQGWDDRGLSFRIEDIEKHGPGIIVDVKEHIGGRLLIWAE